MELRWRALPAGFANNNNKIKQRQSRGNDFVDRIIFPAMN